MDLSRLFANRLNGIDAVYLSTEEVKKFCPIINTSPNIRYPVLGGTLQRRAGTARHDAVAWGYARGCLLYTSPSPRDATLSRMPSSA